MLDKPKNRAQLLRWLKENVGSNLTLKAENTVMKRVIVSAHANYFMMSGEMRDGTHSDAMRCDLQPVNDYYEFTDKYFALEHRITGKTREYQYEGAFDSDLSRLHALTKIEEERELTEEELRKYVELYDYLCSHLVEIPFGVSL